MKRSLVGKWLLIACFCFLFLGMPVGLGACGDAPTYAANGSMQFPYPLGVSEGKCTGWTVVLDSGGASLCAMSLPAWLQVGQYVQVSYSGVSQNMCIVSIDTRHRIMHVQ